MKVWRIRTVRRCILISAAFLPVATVAPVIDAQESSGFRFYSSSFSTGYDTGISTGDIEPVADTLFRIVPGALVWGTTSPRTTLNLIYEPEIEVFHEQTELNALNHAAAVVLRRTASRDLNLDFGGSYLRTNDRSRQTNGLTLAPRGEYVEGRAYGTVRYQLTDQTSLEVGADATYAATPTALGIVAEGATVDDVTGSIRGSLSKSVGRRHSFYGAYAHLRTKLLNPEDFPTTDPLSIRASHSASGGYSFRTGNGLELSGSVGLIYTPDADQNRHTYSLSGRIDKRWQSISLGGGYSRSLAALLRLDQELSADQVRDPLLSNNVTDSATFRFSGQVSERLSIEHQASYSSTKLYTSDDPVEVASASVVLTVRAGTRVAPFASASYWQQSASELFPAISRTRVTGGVRIFLVSLPSRTSLSNSEPARSYLPVSANR